MINIILITNSNAPLLSPTRAAPAAGLSAPACRNLAAAYEKRFRPGADKETLTL